MRRDSFSRTRSRALRLVPLTTDLLRLAVTLERDGATRANTNLLQFDLDPSRNFACLDGGTFVGAGGVHEFADGTREAWMLVSLLATRRQLVQAIRLARGRLNDVTGRIVCFVRIDNVWRANFMRALGFDDAQTLHRDHVGCEYRVYRRGD